MNTLEIKDLRKSFNGFTLDGLNLTLPNGCIMGLIGQNGAGKTTTIKLILDMLHRDSGSIKLFEKPDSTDLNSIKEDIGVVMDEVGITDCLNAKQVGRIMRYTFRNWNSEAYDRYLKKLSIPDNKEFKDFSKGMKMKLGIAIALSHDAKLLLLDEATSGLDPVARDDVIEMLIEFTRDENHSVLISSHIVSDLEKICDYIAFLHDGKLILCEEKDKLLADYCTIHCSNEQLNKLEPATIKHKKVTDYGAEAIVLRKAVPAGIQISPVSIEELFVQTVKGGI